jgi:hypothetical protein
MCNVSDEQNVPGALVGAWVCHVRKTDLPWHHMRFCTVPRLLLDPVPRWRRGSSCQPVTPGYATRFQVVAECDGHAHLWWDGRLSLRVAVG